MTQRPLGTMGFSNERSPLSPLTGSSGSAHEAELSPLKVHHQAESPVLGDPGPVGFDFVLPDDGPEVLWVLSRDFTWRRVSMKDGW